MNRLFALCLASLCSCAGSTDVVRGAGDSFIVANHGVMGWSSGPAQKAKAIDRARAYCEERGARLEVVTARDEPGGFGRIAAAEVEFRCMK
jgi:hypothetical protein